MSLFAPIDRPLRPTNVRYQILAAATAASVILYVHRTFIAYVIDRPDVKNALSLSDQEIRWTYFAFFFPYALAQVPSGWLSDAFGRRRTLTGYIICWSLCTALGGLVMGFLSLFVVRFVLGLAQAGAYPTCGGLLSRWMPPSDRAFGSALVSSGGRIGGIVSPILTALLLVDWGVPWRILMLAYGAVGIAIGFWFWYVSREEPSEHPHVNEAERALIAEGRVSTEAELAAAKQRLRPPMRELLTSPSMWYMCLAQVGTNIGWMFILTDMPKYLRDVKQADERLVGLLGSLVWACGFVGMIVGGRLTDWSTRRLGLRWGRVLPGAITKFVAVGLYFIALESSSPLEAAVAIGAVAFFCDLGVSSMWAVAQDVGGRSVGAVLGWGNMFGNLGGAVASLVYGWTNATLGTESDQSGTLYAAMVGFLVAGAANLGIDAAKPIVSSESETAAE